MKGEREKLKLRKIQIVTLLTALGICILFSSFGNATMLDKKAYVHAMGIDRTEGEYKVSLQVFKPQGSGSDTPVDIVHTNMQVVKTKGKTIREALDNAQYRLGKEIFLGHLQLMCFGKTVDFSNPEELFGFCLKDKTVFLGTKICLAETTAEELMNTEISRGLMTAESFMNTITMNVDNSTTLDCEMIDFLSCIESPQYLAMPVLSVVKNEDDKEQKAEGENKEEEQDMEIEIKNTALVKHGKIIEERLSQDEAEAVAWLTGKAKKSDFVIDTSGEKINVRLTDDGTRIKLKNENGKIKYIAEIKMVAKPSKDIKNNSDTKKIEEKVEERMEKIFEDTELKTLRENEMDVFEIWKLLRHYYPKSYLKYKDKLNDIYDATVFETKIDVRVM